MIELKKTFITGLLLGSLGFATLSSADDYIQKISVNTKPVTLKGNGVEIQFENLNKENGLYFNGKAWVPATMIYDGTTYVPIRIVGESFGKVVEWDGSSRSISFNDDLTSSSPTTKKIPVFVEGITEMREAKLQSGSFNYDMYVLNNFSLEAEEPSKDVILSNYDSSFYVRIEPLDNHVNVEEYKQQLKENLQGIVHELDPNEIFDEFFHDADIYLLQEVKDANVNVSVTHLVKEYNNKKFKFTIHIPSKEAAEGIGPSLWAMLKTMEVK